MNSPNQWPLPPESSQNIKLHLTLQQRLKNWFKFFEFIDVVYGAVVGLFIFIFFGFPASHKQARTEAWNVLNSSLEQTGNGGRSTALQNLVTWQKRRENLINWIRITAIADYLVGQEIDLKGVKANNAFLRKLELKEDADLEYADFSESKFWEATLTKANLRHVDFTKAILQGADLSEVKLGGANLSGADLSCLQKNNECAKPTELKGADLSCLQKNNECAKPTELKGADLSPDPNHPDKYTKLNGADLRHVDLSEAKLDEVDLRGANLHGAILTGATGLDTAQWSVSVITEKTEFPYNFYNFNAVSKGAVLIPQEPGKTIDLEGKTLTDANLNGLNLKNANMANAILKNAQLNGANLEGADLSDVDLSEVNLAGANLRGANLSDTDLSKVKSLKDVDLSRVCYTKDTKFPNGISIPPDATLIKSSENCQNTGA